LLAAKDTFILATKKINSSRGRPTSRQFSLNKSLQEAELVNWDQVQGNWKQLASSVRARWGQLTSDDLNVISGHREELIGRLEQRYGIAKDEARNQVEQWSAGLPDRLVDEAYAAENMLEQRAS
jgi:uncharacterized protein YjbJ (UPF0337 family)